MNRFAKLALATIIILLFAARTFVAQAVGSCHDQASSSCPERVSKGQGTSAAVTRPHLVNVVPQSNRKKETIIQRTHSS